LITSASETQTQARSSFAKEKKKAIRMTKKTDSVLELTYPNIIGIVKAIDYDSKEVIFDTTNQVNFESMSYALALSLAGRPNGNIMQMVFGNGATAISAVGTITYQAPNVTGLTVAELYNQTYQKFVDDLSPLNTNPANNFIRVNHTLGNTYSDIVVTCLLDYNEPSGQEAFDNATSSGDFIFDEIGLRTYDSISGVGYLLSHVIFHPVQKSLNRRIEIIYSLRIIMS
jgi:hypothetical protein